MTYPHAVNLPFNRTSIRGMYEPPHTGETDSGPVGYRIIMHGDVIVVDEANADLVLHTGELDGLVDADHVQKRLIMGSWLGRPLELVLTDGEGGLADQVRAEPLLALSFTGGMNETVLTIAGMANQLALWEKKSAFCPRCGGAAAAIPGLWGKRCAGCGFEHFPAIYPCTLVLVWRGDEVLLVRKREWPPDYFSLPSGFCDLGECLEECAGREVLEETGVGIKNLTFVGSQCWPFPSQLMVGFTAEYDCGEVIPDLDELESVRWFRCDSMPPTFSSRSIAGWMIERHLAARRKSKGGAGQ